MLFHNLLSNQRIWCSLQGMSCIGANFRCSIWRCHWNTMKVNTHWEESSMTLWKLPQWNWCEIEVCLFYWINFLGISYFSLIFSLCTWYLLIFLNNFNINHHIFFIFLVISCIQLALIMKITIPINFSCHIYFEKIIYLSLNVV